MLNHYVSDISNSESETLPSSPFKAEPLYKEKNLYETSLQRIDKKVHEVCQDYTVSNVSQYMFRTDDFSTTDLECPEFSSGIETYNDKWIWRMMFSHGPDTTWIHFFANCVKSDVRIKAMMTIYIIDSEGFEIFAGRRSDKYYNSFDKQIARFFDKRKDIDKKKFLPNNSLTVRLKVTILLDDITPFYPYMQLELEPKTNLPSNFKELYLSRENTGDLVVKIKDQLFRMHKDVLKIRYPQLLDMIAIQIIQGKKIFEITGIDCKVFEKLLEFMYLEEVTDIDDCIVPLWKAAHKYKLTALRSICEKIISENFLSAENADIVNNIARKIGSSKFCFYINLFIEKNREN